MKVKTTARTWVVPSIPTEEHWLSLSNLDRVVNPTFVSLVCFYEGVLNRTGYAEVVTTLKESLKDVLVEFYPLAGRLALRKDGLVDLHCNDAGVMFLEAVVDKELREAAGGGSGGGYGQPFPTLSGLDAARLGPGPVYLPDQLMSIPVLIIQLTQFTCKSIALAVDWHHSVADGFSGCHFVRSWSEVARGEPMLARPVHRRDLLKPREPLDPSLIQEGYSTRRLKVDDLHQVARLWKEPAVSKVFHIGQEGVQKLRGIITVEDETTDQFTTVEVVSAYLWKAMVRARGGAHDHRDDCEARSAAAAGCDTTPKRTRFFMFVDGRKRLNLPPGYFGNVVCSACAVSDETEIRTRSLSHIAMIIRKATRSISEDYFRSLIDWVEVKGLTSSKSEHVNSVGHDVAGTFWIHFPLYEIDFGWGTPTFATRNAPPRALIDGVGMMPSPLGPGNMAAVLNLHSDRMKNLEADPLFASLFSPAPGGVKMVGGKNSNFGKITEGITSSPALARRA